MTQPDVVALCGSLRDDSYTRIALDHALDAASERGASAELIDLRDYDLPVFDADRRDAGDSPALRERIRRADAVIIGTPTYHGSYATPVKNALDYCGFDEFENKTVGLLGVAGGGFPLTPLDHLRSVCRALDAWVLPYQAAIPQASEKFSDGELADTDLAERVAVLGQRIVDYANIEPDPPHLESTENVGADD